MSAGLIQAPSLAEISGVVHGFTTREGGVSEGPYASLNLSFSTDDTREAVRENRRRVLEALGRPDGAWISLRQVHSVDVVQVTAQAGRSIEADGLWTRDRGAVVAVLIADCVPVLLADRAGTVVAAVHAGWRGTQAHIVKVMVKRLKDAGVDPADLVAAIGPAISLESFEVGPEVAQALEAAFPEPREAIRPGEGDRFHADLWALNERDLLESGVPAHAIDVLRLDTLQRSELYSHRGDDGVTGRQAGVIGFAPVF